MRSHYEFIEHTCAIYNIMVIPNITQKDTKEKRTFNMVFEFKNK